MPKVTETYLEQRRQQILDAAIVCFARKGFHQTTMEDIGKEAGLSSTVPYRYFDGKEDIILATIQHSLDRMRRFYETEVEEEDTLRALEQIADDHLQKLEQPGRDIYYKVRVQLWAEALQDPEVAEEAGLLRKEGLEQFAEIIRKGQERGQIDPNLDAMAVSIAFAASHDGFVLHWLADPDVDIWQYRTVLMAMIRGLFNHQG
jgi:TetR/AcrR family transcriptional repressor of uid operon